MQYAKIQAAGLVLLVSLLSAISLASAEPKPAGDGGVAIKKAQGLIRQLSQEKTALEAEKTAWLTEKTALESKLKSREQELKKLEPLPAEVERYKIGLETVKTSLEGLLGQERQNRQALLQKHNDMIVKANAINADNQLLVQAVREREQWIEQCSQHNQDLRKVNLDILSKYREKGLLQQIGELEPFTGIAQVETESTIEDYRYKLQQLKITPYKPSQQPVVESAPAVSATDNPGEALESTRDPSGKAVGDVENSTGIKPEPKP
jgi:Skp family chaperone for outer membrane proteins